MKEEVRQVTGCATNLWVELMASAFQQTHHFTWLGYEELSQRLIMQSVDRFLCVISTNIDFDYFLNQKEK
jgi:hypothetical protein